MPWSVQRVPFESRTPAQAYPVDSAQPGISMGFPPASARTTTATAVWLPAAWRMSLHSRLEHSGQTRVFACTGFRSERGRHQVTRVRIRHPAAGFCVDFALSAFGWAASTDKVKSVVCAR